MPSAYSTDLRERVVRAYEESNETIAQISERFEVSTSSVKRYLRLSRESGNLVGGCSPGRPRHLDSEQLDSFRQMVEDHPDLREVDYQRMWSTRHGRISQPTVNRTIKRLGLSLKKRPSGSKPASVSESENSNDSTRP